MAEYIKREAVIDLITRRYENPEICTQEINSIPVADVAPVLHARWEDKPNPQWKAYDIRYCTACGWSIHKSKLRNSDLNWAYCPSCGARMDGGMTDGAIHL